jgi:hypothetical protein
MDDMQPEIEIDLDGNKFWTLDGKYHRLDGPAAEWADGDKYWWHHDSLHRTDGPAIEEADGSIEWFWLSQPVTFEEWLDNNTELTDEGKVMMKLQYG